MESDSNAAHSNMAHAIENIAQELSVAMEGIENFVDAPNVTEGTQILLRLAALQAPLDRLATVVNANDILARGTHNAHLQGLNGQISTALAATTRVFTRMTDLIDRSITSLTNAAAELISEFGGSHDYLPPRLDGPTPRTHVCRTLSSHPKSQCRDEVASVSGG
ncbi:hypothetical protein M413DRAFT_447583 [Hebeloma cylindrosporum]|uniref:Uncharacterized protein n=1 Tax=Hebeloma cylindrosporum TaxID=76867 RepID=A0A0C3BQJ4_HEBCY|nr:hypothetical protein M413DRAFT_447583 [Hebeloma cylindrosporum h7]